MQGDTRRKSRRERQWGRTRQIAGGFLLLLFIFWLPGCARETGALAEIHKRGAVIIGSDMTYPPFELKTGDHIEGFDIDLGNEIGKELGVRVQWENFGWDGIFPALKAGKFDLVMSDVVITDKRKEELGFSQPYFLSGQTIVRRKDDTRIQKAQDLLDKLIAVQTETTGQYAMEELGFPKQNERKFNTMQLALLETRNGRVDAAVGDLPALKDMLRKGYPELELVGGIFKHENYGVVMRKGDPDLLLAVNQALDKIVADGRYATLYARWIGEPLPAGYARDLAKVKNQGTALSARSTGSTFSIRWSVLRSALPLLLQGALMTLRLTAFALLFGIPLGLLLALSRISRFPPLSVPTLVYVEVVRGTPLLIQIFVIYFVLPAIHLSLSQVVAAVIALSLNAGAYISEIFRAGIESIDVGQMEAARSLGMDYPQAMRWVILPQTLRRVLPPLTNEAVALLKDTSLVSIIGLAELTRVGNEQSSNTGAVVTVMLAVALLYLVMTLPLTHLVRRLEARWQPISKQQRDTANLPVQAQLAKEG